MSPENEADMKRQLKRAGIIGGCVLVAIVVIGGGIRFVQASSLKTWTQEAEVPTVSLIKPQAGGKSQSLILPGTLQAYYDAQLYSRVPGYVHAWYKDIGARVKKGDVLALIDTPELDQQITQARADVGAAQSNQKLSAVTAERWNSLLPLDAVSKQDAEEKNTDLASKAGATKATQANLDRLLAMKEFARIVAPFDGTVTRRTVDVGALVSGGPGSSGDPLFAVSDIHVLRVYVNVPQSYSAQIVPGMQVTLTVPEYPGRTFSAKLDSTSNAISAQSSTLLVEFQADNAAGLLKPGDYAEVSMGLPGGGAHLRLPASALMFRAEGLRVATVGANNRVLMKPISIETDLGTQVIVASGLTPGDRVVDNPPDSLGNGDAVRVEGAGHAD
jgi:multidrug efflux system membrane fusion protein